MADNLSEAKIAALLDEADRARGHSYAPYSSFSVGAALLADDGTVTTGCNIENASYGATMCAERVALFSAVASGKRHFVAIAVTGSGDYPVMPCGLCRQALTEFAPDLTVIAANTAGGRELTSLAALLPRPFRKP
jgi:cytidine deaminase